MRKIRISAFLGAFGSVLTSTSFAAEPFQPDGFSDFRSPGAISVADPLDVLKEDLKSFSAEIEDDFSPIDIRVFLDRGDRLVVDYVQSGLRDDSVSTINRRWLLSRTEGGKYKLIGYGFRQKCYRAEDIEAWTDEPCL